MGVKTGTMWRTVAACAALGLAAVASASVKDEFIRIGEDVGTKIALDPADFLFDIHLTSEDHTPLPIDKDFEVTTNLFPSFIPFTELGAEFKAKLKREHGGWPQIDMNLGGWDSIAGSVISGQVKDFKGTLWGLHGGLLATGSVDPRLRLFGGYEFSQMRVDIAVTFNNTKTNSGTGFDLQNSFSKVNVGKTEHFLVAGAEVLRTTKKRLVAEIDYGVVSNKLVAKLTWASRSFDTGIAFYPESAWVLWPIWNFQVRF
jgi:hypothetical protein